MKTHNAPQMSVSLQISSPYIQSTIQHLIDNNIPFTLTYNGNIHLLETTQTPPTVSIPDGNTSRKQGVIEQIHHKYLNKNFDKEPPPIQEIATEFGMSAQTIRNQFKAFYGKTFYQCYMDKKIEYAAQLLKKGHNAQKVTEMIGYSKTSAIKFNKMFQKYFGMTPKKYQMEHYGSLNKRK